MKVDLFLGTAATTAIGITGLTAASATLAGVGGLVAVVGAGAVLGGLAAAAVRGAGSRGGSQRGGRRGKRSPVDQEMIGEQFVFDAIATMDTIDCGKRYLCEIAATPLEELTQEELSSLLLFQVKIFFYFFHIFFNFFSKTTFLEDTA